jgi:hypothetical protein
MADSFPSADIPLTIHGFVTDPKLVGYQILTNYESNYWRSLVGAPAWSLYEVLRSYCHNGQQECYPSINLLMAILDIKERRIITGRITSVNGTEYRYPGLIDLLQQHGLVIAQEVGAGPMMRYMFHVNLTPGLLSEAQLAQLPDLLQQKHKELLERCQQAIKELQAKRRPSRVQKSVEQPSEGGLAICQRGLAICRRGLAICQTNNTQLILPIEQQPRRGKKRTTTTQAKQRRKAPLLLLRWFLTALQRRLPNG